MSRAQLSAHKMIRIPALGLVTAVLSLLPMTSLAAVTPPSGAFAVGSATSGICMEAAGETSGSAVVLDNCNNQINQKWYTNRAGYYQGAIAYDIETAKAGSFQCLNDQNGSTAAGSLVNLAQCNGINSAMRFVKQGNQLYNAASGECLDSSTVGAQLVLNACDPTASTQMWFNVANNAKP